MARPLRIESPGAHYPATSGGNAGLSRNVSALFCDEPSWLMRACKLGDMPAQRKIGEARRLLTPEQRLLMELQLSDVGDALRRAGSEKR